MSHDLYQVVTDKIISQLESGVAPWVQPWKSGKGNGCLPYNATTGKAYRGINVALLWNDSYTTPAWLTYKQAADIGANVRKGEHGSLIVFYKPFTVKDKNSTEGKEKTIPLLKSYTVFNVAQIENLPESMQPKIDVRPEVERHALAESLLSKATIVHGGDKAFYRTTTDTIHLPQSGQFNDMGSYYATALHELTHWTGNSARLAREYGKRYGDQAYAREELVAEMGAAFTCAYCGIEARLEHASYIASWIKVLKEDKRAVIVAASAAQKAADFITGYVREEQVAA